MIAKTFNHFKLTSLLIGLSLIVSCQTIISTKKITSQGLVLPFIKNTPNECYYLDEFMPVPNNMVTGKSGSLNLRYYNYNQANYKEWTDRHIILSFYSRDNKCWSLFEEFYVVD